MALGLMMIPVGIENRHVCLQEQIVYVIASGCGVVSIAEACCPIVSGQLIAIDTGVPHSFHSVTEELTLLVIQCPKEKK